MAARLSPKTTTWSTDVRYSSKLRKESHAFWFVSVAVENGASIHSGATIVVSKGLRARQSMRSRGALDMMLETILYLRLCKPNMHWSSCCCTIVVTLLHGSLIHEHSYIYPLIQICTHLVRVHSS